jgi:hypothetical protein
MTDQTPAQPKEEPGKKDAKKLIYVAFRPDEKPEDVVAKLKQLAQENGFKFKSDSK